MKNLTKKLAGLIVFATFLFLFTVFVWPTQWRDLPLKTIGDQQFHQRQNRLNDEVETWVPDSTEKINRQLVWSHERGTWSKEY